jgi:hypothetical protein
MRREPGHHALVAIVDCAVQTVLNLLSLGDATAVSSNELIHVIRAQASPFEVFASQPELCVDIVIANGFAGLVHVNQRSMHLKQRDHLVHALLHHKRVDFSGWFINKVTLAGGPIVLEIAPGTTQHEPEHGRGVEVAVQNPRLFHAQEINPVTFSHLPR